MAAGSTSSLGRVGARRRDAGLVSTGAAAGVAGADGEVSAAGRAAGTRTGSGGGTAGAGAGTATGAGASIATGATGSGGGTTGAGAGTTTAGAGTATGAGATTGGGAGGQRRRERRPAPLQPARSGFDGLRSELAVGPAVFEQVVELTVAQGDEHRLVLLLHHLPHGLGEALLTDVLGVRGLGRLEDATAVREQVRDDVRVPDPESSVCMWNTRPLCRTLLLKPSRGTGLSRGTGRAASFTANVQGTLSQRGTIKRAPRRESIRSHGSA